jgi:adenosylcobinamide-phosphate synthase
VDLDWYALVFATAFALDVTQGEVPARVHPVVWMGKLARFMIDRLPRRGSPALLGGASIVLVVVGLFGAAGWGVERATESRTVLAWMVQSFVLTTTFSVRLLVAEAAGLADLLVRGELAEARLYLPRLCSRDASALPESAIAGAGLSSVTENLVDSVVAPWFWWLAFGLPGALAYRAINTLDAMIGYRGEYEQLGKAAAKLDDWVNWIPARLSGALLLAVGGATGLPARRAGSTMLQDHARTPSPNGGWPMAAAAGLLDARLEKAGAYVLNSGGGDATPAHLVAGCALVRRSAWTAACLVTTLAILLLP